MLTLFYLFRTKFIPKVSLIQEHPIGDFTIFVTRKQSNEQRYYIYSERTRRITVSTQDMGSHSRFAGTGDVGA